MNKNLLVAVLMMVAIISGCEQEGSVEQVGEAIDDTTKQLREKGQDMGNRVEDACEDMKETLGAADTDC